MVTQTRLMSRADTSGLNRGSADSNALSVPAPEMFIPINHNWPIWLKEIWRMNATNGSVIFWTLFKGIVDDN